MANGTANTSGKKPALHAAIGVILVLLAIAIVVWVLMGMMGCAATGEQGASGESAGAETSADASADDTELVEAWIPAAATLYTESDETGELEASARVALTRDELGRLTSVEETYYAGGATTSLATTNYAYDDAGALVSSEVVYSGGETSADAGSDASTETSADTSADAQPAIASTYEYDPATGRLSVVTVQGEGSTGRELFDYDDAGNVTTIMQTYDYQESTITYLTNILYDEQGRPVSVESGEDASQSGEGNEPTTTATWAYDADQRLSAFSVLPLGEDATNLMDYSLTYDEAGNVASVACAPGGLAASDTGSPADAAGYTATVTYAYDEQGRCTGAKASGSYTYGASFETSATCAYDEHGNLARVDFTDTNAFEGQESTQRYALECTYEQAELPADAVEHAGATLSLEPSYSKQLFSAYLAEPAIPLTPNFAPVFAAATRLGYEPVLGM